MGLSAWYYFSCMITKTPHQTSLCTDIMYSTNSTIHLTLTPSNFNDINIEEGRDKENIVLLME